MKHAALIGTVVAGISLIAALPWLRSGPKVVAKSNAGVIITGTVEKDAQIEVATYDTADERRRHARTFAGSATRLCQRYLSEAASLTLQAGGRGQTVPNYLFDGLSFEANLAEAIGPATYRRIASEEEQLRHLAADLTLARLQYRAEQSARATGMASADEQPAAVRISALQTKLIALTRAHCSLLSELSR